MITSLPLLLCKFPMSLKRKALKEKKQRTFISSFEYADIIFCKICVHATGKLIARHYGASTLFPTMLLLTLFQAETKKRQLIFDEILSDYTSKIILSGLNSMQKLNGSAIDLWHHFAQMSIVSRTSCHKIDKSDIINNCFCIGICILSKPF